LKDEINNRAILLEVEETKPKFMGLKKNGLPSGVTTGWRQFDQHFLFPPIGNLNVVTGFPGSGKSAWVDALSVNMIKNHDWNIFSYSPESFPPEYHLQKLAEMYVGKPFEGNWNHYEVMTDQEASEAFDYLNSKITFIDTTQEYTSIKQIINSITDECMEKQVKMAILDPWNCLDDRRPTGISKTDFISTVLEGVKTFSRKNAISFWIVAHPSKPAKLSNGKWAECTLYDIEDSRHWFGKIDNGFIVNRSWDDKLHNTESVVRIAKIKDDRYGKVGDCNFEFNRANRQFKAVDSPSRKTTDKQVF